MVLKWDGQSLFVMNQDLRWYKKILKRSWNQGTYSGITKNLFCWKFKIMPALIFLYKHGWGLGYICSFPTPKMQTPFIEMPTLPISGGRAPYFCRHFCPFWHLDLATSLFLASFVPLKLHVIMKTLFFVWILDIFWMLMLASLLLMRFEWIAIMVISNQEKSYHLRTIEENKWPFQENVYTSIRAVTLSSNKLSDIFSPPPKKKICMSEIHSHV